MFIFRLHAGETATPEEIKEFCKGQVGLWTTSTYVVNPVAANSHANLFFFQISHYKIPRYIKFTDEFPLTVTGKVRA